MDAPTTASDAGPIIVEVLRLIKDPILIILTVIICALLFINWQKDKTLIEAIKEIAAVSENLATLTALISVLVNRPDK